MSSRVLKKLQGITEQQLEHGCSDSDENEDDYDDNDVKNSKSHLNPFDLLNQQSLSESEIKEDDNETEYASVTANILSTSNSADKKKKKKRKKKVKSSFKNISSEDNEHIDKCSKKVYPSLGKVFATAVATPGYKRKQQNKKLNHGVYPLLGIELKHLNAQNEMRRTFGKRVVKTDAKRRQKVTLKTTHLITAKDNWPPIAKNIITMKPVSPPEGNYDEEETYEKWFAFEHSKYYQSMQMTFLNELTSNNSDFLVNLIKRYPYHVDSLIQLSELCKITENYPLAIQLVERALYTLESSLHINFSLINGDCRLDYRRQENRAFFIVLFKHAQQLEARACSRTAFEIAKLILSLQPEVDPLAMILVIDYYALRCKQYEWLVSYYETYDPVRNLSQLPNMAYSYALALHQLYSVCEKSNKALQYALLMFPGVLKPLLDELSVKTDARVLASSYFNSEVSGSQSPALHQLVCLYICRAKVIWRLDNILHWLEQNVNAALDRIEHKDPIINEYKRNRSMRYQNPPRPILRHVILADYRERVPLAVFLTRETAPIMAYDPLPPIDSINKYAEKLSSLRNSQRTNNPISIFFQSLLPNFHLNRLPVGNAGVVAADDNAVNDGIAIELNVDEGVVAAQAAPNQNHMDDLAAVNAQLQFFDDNLPRDERNADNGSFRDLVESLGNIVGAMRDFLHNSNLTNQLHPTEANSARTSNNSSSSNSGDDSSDNDND